MGLGAILGFGTGYAVVAGMVGQSVADEAKSGGVKANDAAIWAGIFWPLLVGVVLVIVAFWLPVKLGMAMSVKIGKPIGFLLGKVFS